MRDPSPSVLARSVVLLAALAAMAALAAGQAEPTHAAETGYLAALATAALAAVAAMAPAPAWELGIGATAAVTAVWALPPGPGRGGALVAVLVASLTVAAGRRLAASLPELPAGAAVALAFGLQVLLRGELLLAPGLAPRPLVALLGLPLAAGVAAASLARGRGAVPALLALGTTALAGSGFNVAATLGLVALAAGDLAGRPTAWRWGLAARTAALAVMLVPIAWEPRAGAVAAACGLALAGRGVVGPAVAMAIALALGGLAALRPLVEALPLLARLPLLVPALPAVLLRRDREAWLLALAGVSIAAGAAHVVPDPTGLAAPLALAALALGRAGAAPAIQAAWTAILLGLAGLAASYPWLRPEPALAALSFLGLGPGLRPVAALLAAALALAAITAIAALLARRRGPEAAGRPAVLGVPIVGLAAGAAAVAIVAALPPAGRPLAAGEVVLDAARPSWSVEIPAAVSAASAASAVLVESSLANSTALPPGAPVATLRLHDQAGETFEWTLRAGRDTGEWAAARPDLAPRLEAPAPWLSYVAGSFFGQRYRGRWELPAPRPIVRAEVERRTDLPADLALALYQVEVRP